MNQKGSVFNIELQVLVQGVVETREEKGNELMIKFEDGTILKLLASDKKTMTQFYKSPITNLKIKVANYECDLPKITSKKTSEIPDSFSCLLLK